MKKIFFILLILACSQTELSFGQTRLDSLVKISTYTLEGQNDRLIGNGVDVIKQASVNAQFVLIGEEHNSKVIPDITAILFSWLQREFNFQYLATEQDPVMMEQVSRLPIKTLEQVHQLASKYPNGFTFISDQELSMLHRIGSTSLGKHDAIWGCEQTFGITHVTDALLSISDLSTEQRVFLMRLKLYANKFEQKRDLSKFRLMSDPGKRTYLDTLKNHFENSTNQKAKWYSEALSMSDSLYQLFHESKSVPALRYWNNYVREEYMKKVFIDHYESAQAKDGKPPRVLFKFGHLHLHRGRNPNFIFSLGNFVTELANRNGKQTVSIFVAYNSVEEKVSSYHLLPFAKYARQGTWTLVDLRPLRPYFRFDLLQTNFTPAVQRAFENIVFGFDFLLMISKQEKATFSVAQSEY